MSIGRRIIGSTSGLLVLIVALFGTGIGMMAWVRSWYDGYVAASEQAGALSDPGLRDMLNSLNTQATVIMVVMAVLGFLALGLGVSALVRLGPTVDRKLKAVVSSIGDSITEMKTVGSEVAAATAETATATNETTATVEEVRQTAVLAQEKAGESSELAKKVVEMSEAGRDSAERNYDHFEQILADMEEVSEAITRLNKHAEAVGEVMVTVNDLAEQSNLLSVNASIEAFKSGEAGKGFGVVAQEVKNLALQSKQAVVQVRDVLNQIQGASNVVIKAAEQTRETVEVGRNEASKAVQSITERVAVGTQSAEAASAITVSSHQQLSGLEQIGSAVASITEASGHSGEGMRRVEQEVERLREAAEGLEHLLTTRTKRG